MSRWLGVYSLVVAAAMVFLVAGFGACGREVSPTARQDCADNLKQLALVFKMYANESQGQMYPALDAAPGNLMCRAADLYPEYAVDPLILICPADRKAMAAKPDVLTPETVVPLFTDRDYWYLGFAIKTEEEGMAFVEAYRAQAASGNGFEADLTSKDGKPIYRLRNGIERVFITDTNNPASSAIQSSRIPVVIERPGHHEDQANVMYLDGHVESLKYPGKFPMTEQFIKALKSLDRLKKK